MRRRSDLRAYQHRVADWLYQRDTAIAVLDMGSGKTAAALTAIADLLDDGVVRHALVIAPKRVAEIVWPAELGAWEHLAGLRWAVLDGDAEQRAAALAAAPSRQVTIVGVDLTQWLVETLQRLDEGHPVFDLLLIDESSRLKSPGSKRACALLELAADFRNRWGLTGTPRPNSEADLYMQAAVISAGQLWPGSFYRWQQQRFRLDRSGYRWTIRPEWRDRTLAEFGSIAITLDEGDMPDLPDINTVIDMVELPPQIREPYRDMQRRLFTELAGRDIEAVSAAVATGKLAQMVAGFVYDNERGGPATQLHTLKLDWLSEIVASLDGQPLLVAYEFIEDVARLKARFGADLPVLGGQTSSKDAAAIVAAWNEGALPILALHPASAGHGLNLQHGGSHLAWLGLTWSAELYDQTIKRIHRPGQRRHCTVHLCLARGTIDEMKRDRVVEKLSAQDAFRGHLNRV
jgi:hypothetical protein